MLSFFAHEGPSTWHWIPGSSPGNFQVWPGMPGTRYISSLYLPFIHKKQACFQLLLYSMELNSKFMSSTKSTQERRSEESSNLPFHNIYCIQNQRAGDVHVSQCRQNAARRARICSQTLHRDLGPQSETHTACIHLKETRAFPGQNFKSRFHLVYLAVSQNYQLLNTFRLLMTFSLSYTIQFCAC